MNYEEIFQEAIKAAETAVQLQAKSLEGKDMGFDCGFAWVIVKPATGPFVKWAKSKIKEAGFKYDSSGNLQTLSGAYAAGGSSQRSIRKYGSKSYTGGWQFWEPGADSYRGQSISVFEKGSYAFAAVLKANGIDCYVDSRLD